VALVHVEHAQNAMTPDERRLYMRGYAAALVAERKRNGLCVKCGGEQVTRYQNCLSCRQKRNSAGSVLNCLASPAAEAHSTDSALASST
jgi:hypothetical protein